MVLSKRERVIRTLELDDEPDRVPITTIDFEKTCTAYQHFIKTEEYNKSKLFIKNSYKRFRNNWVGDITTLRFWNVDCHGMDPFNQKLKMMMVPAPEKYPKGYIMNLTTGAVFSSQEPQVETGIPYSWYIDGYYTTPEILYSHWDEHGRPSEHINDKINYSPKIWDEYVESLSPYLYPMGRLWPLFEGIPMHEALFEGMTMSRVAYYMRKNPQYIHEVMQEYTKVNVECIKRLAEAGVDIVFYADDLGFKNRSIMSINNLRKFMIPYYKQIYQECKKHGMFVVQHSCGYIDKILPDMVDAGLNCIQALETAAGVDLANLKETLGDKVSFMGGLDSSGVLSFGTPQDIAENVKKCIITAGQGGGYFVGPSNSILNVPWENCVALRDATEKYGKYPLNF